MESIVGIFQLLGTFEKYFFSKKIESRLVFEKIFLSLHPEMAH